MEEEPGIHGAEGRGLEENPEEGEWRKTLGTRNGGRSGKEEWRKIRGRGMEEDPEDEEWRKTLRTRNEGRSGEEEWTKTLRNRNEDLWEEEWRKTLGKRNEDPEEEEDPGEEERRMMLKKRNGGRPWGRGMEENPGTHGAGTPRQNCNEAVYDG